MSFQANDPDVDNVSKLETASVNSQGVSVGQQIADESDHAIKYRTCSWQKVLY